MQIEKMKQARDLGISLSFVEGDSSGLVLFLPRERGKQKCRDITSRHSRFYR